MNFHHSNFKNIFSTNHWVGWLNRQNLMSEWVGLNKWGHVFGTQKYILNSLIKLYFNDEQMLLSPKVKVEVSILIYGWWKSPREIRYVSRHSWLQTVIEQPVFSIIQFSHSFVKWIYSELLSFWVLQAHWKCRSQIKHFDILTISLKQVKSLRLFLFLFFLFCFFWFIH